MVLIEIIFWVCVVALVHTHVGYPLILRALSRRRAGQPGEGAVARAPNWDRPPAVALIVAAHDEQDVIERKVADALALDYPRELLQIVIACDGCNDATAERARAAGADLVLELERGGKVSAQNDAVQASEGEVLAFSDANSYWEPDALVRLVERLADERVGYVCGRVELEPGEDGENQEGIYWRYEMAVRTMESELEGITAGNGAIYAVRRDAYVFFAPSSGHDLALPPQLAKDGLRSVYEPEAVASELMAASSAAEYARKRRMMVRTWGVLLRSDLLDPRGYRPAFLFELYSHRLLRYASPFLHFAAFLCTLVLLGHGWVYALALIVQVALLAAAAFAGVLPYAPLRLARYYVSVTASSAIGLFDYLRHGPRASWERSR